MTPQQDREPRVAIVDDDPSVLGMVGEVVREEGAEVACFLSGESFLESRPGQFDLILSDFSMSGISGLQLLEGTSRRDPQARFVLMTGQGTIGLAVEALKLGASDFLTKPSRLFEIQALVRDTRARIAGPGSGPGAEDRDFVVGRSAAWRRLMDRARRIADLPVTVLLRGETGAGKEVLARYIASFGARAAKPFVSLNCAAVPENRIQRELFGQAPIAASGGEGARRGRLEEADGGTLFLDNIHVMDAASQRELLRVLEDRSVRRVGGDHETSIDVRIIAATNIGLESAVARGAFRSDLYFRLAVVALFIPPLRDRREDIAPLVAHFLKTLAGPGETPRYIAPEAFAMLERHPLPGNARELRNVIENAMSFSSGPEISAKDVASQMGEIWQPGKQTHAPERNLRLTEERIKEAPEGRRNQAMPPADQDIEDPADFAFLVRQWRVPAVTTIACLLGAAILNAAVRPVYEARSDLAISEIAAGGPLLTDKVPADSARAAAVQKQVVLMRSPEFAGRLVNSLGPAARVELVSGPVAPWAARITWSFRVAMGSSIPPDPIGIFRSRLQLSHDARSNLIGVQISAFRAEIAAEIANAVVEQYLRETLDSNAQMVESSRRAIAAQIATKEQRLGEQLNVVQSAESQSRLAELKLRKGVLEQRLKFIELSVARSGEAAEDPDRSSGAAAPAPSDLVRKGRVADLAARKKDLLLTLGPKHPSVIAVQQQLDEARRDLGRQTTGTATRQRAMGMGPRTLAEAGRIQGELAGIERESLRYTLDRKKLEAETNSIDSLLDRQAASSATIIDARVIERARPPSSPVSPETGRNLGYGLALGLFVGVLLAWLRDRFDRSVHSSQDLERAVRLRVLGVVPYIRELKDTSLVEAIADAGSGLADSLNLVKTNILHGTTGPAHKVLVLTGAGPGEGKSIVAAGLAIVFTRNDGRVLLIDADLRRPSIHKIFELPQRSGLSDILSAEGPVSLRPKRGTLRNLDILTSGVVDSSSSERLGSSVMKALIGQARSRYDWVIINAPPTLGLPDVPLLGTLADGIVVVCSASNTPITAVRHAIDELRLVQAPILGLVLNRAERGRNPYYGDASLRPVRDP